MNYELIIPDTLWRDEELRAVINRDLNLPALAQLYGKGRKTALASADFSAGIAQRFGLSQFAAAPMLLAKDCPDAQAGFWLRADPIHLRIDRDRLTVLGVPFFQINQAEADALVAALNQLFNSDGYTFIAATPTRWYLRLPQDPALRFTPLDVALGCNMQECLPQGEAALKFHAVINEIQMVLYGHSVNDERDAVGQPMINSVWLWGGGVFPAATPAQKMAVPIWGGDEFVQALAGDAWQAAPPSAQGLPAHDVTIVLADLCFDAIYGNAYEWRTQWEQLEKNWFAPLRAQLKSGQLEQLTLTLPSSATQVIIKRMDLYRFWRAACLPF